MRILHALERTRHGHGTSSYSFAGQEKPVFAHKLVAAGTIEEKMELLKEKKRALAESLFDHDGEPTLAMTESDLDMLFAAD